MTEEQRLVYVRGRILSAEIEMQAMIAENQERVMNGESVAYNEDAFRALTDHYGLDHNSLITELVGH